MAKTAGQAVMPVARIEQAILLVRGEKVILDASLAELYGVPTKVLNQAVKRNADRFPEDFMFQLTWEEANCLRSQNATSNGEGSDHDLRSQSVTSNGEGSGHGSRSQTVTLNRGRNVKYRPYAFTEHGAIMAATVLNSPRAVEVSVYVVRAFVRLRQMLAQNKEFAAKLADLERKVGGHDQQLIALVQALRQLMAPPPEKPRKPIGFHSQMKR